MQHQASDSSSNRPRRVRFTLRGRLCVPGRGEILALKWADIDGPL